MISHVRTLFLLILLTACTSAKTAVIEVNAGATTRSSNSDQNSNDELAQQKIIAIGDVHGDFDQLVKLMRSLELIDKRNRWIGGQTHLVQMGDIPDRAPDSRKAMDLLMKLEKAAAKKGGAVTVLIGNHEAMMMTNDLRDVHPGEYESFKDRNSKARRDAVYKDHVDRIKNTSETDALPVFDKAYRAEWNTLVPLGYVEHRLAWLPSGKYGKWVLSHQAVAKVGDSLFVHGGLSTKFSDKSISELNMGARTELVDPTLVNANSITSEFGPLWFRGWGYLLETPENEALLDSVLSAYGVKRMVVAHTPRLPIVLPRFSGKLLMVDVGLSKFYKHGGFAALEINSKVATAVIQGERLTLPTDQAGINDYLDAAQLLIADDGRIDKYQATVERAFQEYLSSQNDPSDKALAPVEK